jgi:hypothetical protein
MLTKINRRIPWIAGKLEAWSQAMQLLKQKFFQVDGPTWLVALVLYGAWVLLVWFNGVALILVQ